MKLNLGSGNIPLSGFTNVDLRPPADVVGDFTLMDFVDVEEVEMSHSLEHLSFRDVLPTLQRIRSWMRPGGTLRVEVPDLGILLDMDPCDGNFQQWMFGAQDVPGQYHCSGFVAESLQRALESAGWTVTGVRTFISANGNRPGYPCLEARAVA